MSDEYGDNESIATLQNRIAMLKQKAIACEKRLREMPMTTESRHELMQEIDGCYERIRTAKQRLRGLGNV